jgi:DNA-binding transcriptional ArsR family regulator
MRQLIYVTRALADQNRVKALYALQAGELCVCQIVEFLALAPSTVSKHMSVLKQAGLVEARKEGRWNYYRLPGRDAPKVVKKSIALVWESLAQDPRTKRNEKRLSTILKTDPTELCKRQCCSREQARNANRNKSLVLKEK